jgi:5'-nucleotidase / UDP-sugar diphosphatase
MKISIIHTNDVHGQLASSVAPNGSESGGYARRATFIKQKRSNASPVFLLDAGDSYQGGRHWARFRGRPDIELMNMLEYDAATFGNHDFDAGCRVAIERMEQAVFPLLGANLRFRDGRCRVKPYTVLERDGIRLGVLGLVVPDTSLFAEEFQAHGLLMDPIATARELVPLLRAQVDFVICLSHLGEPGDLALARAVSGIDLIVGGHDHLGLSRPLGGTTPIVRADAGGHSVGFATLEKVHGLSALTGYELTHIAEPLQEDAPVAAFIAREERALPKAVAIGSVAAALDTRTLVKSTGESVVGRFFARALFCGLRDEVDLALVHSGAMRGERCFGPGEITDSDLEQLHPFRDAPQVLRLRVAHLWTALERGFASLPGPDVSYLAVAGARVTVDLSRKPQILDPTQTAIVSSGERVVRVQLETRELHRHDQDTLRVAVDGYMGKGFAGFVSLKRADASYAAALPLQTYLQRQLERGPVPDRDVAPGVQFINSP